MLRDARVAAILPAMNIERAKEFYTKRLGLRSADMPVPEDGAAFEAGDCTMLYLYERQGGTRADHTVAGWLVEDLSRTVDELRDRGIAFEQYDMPGLKTDERGIAASGPAKSAWFKDSEGNILAITEIAR
jgi:predicted enzyme related to lactoylglutathione lyase